MRPALTLTVCSLFLLGACRPDDNATPRTHPLQQDLAGQEFSFKVKTEDWVEQGIPGNDTYGHAVNKDVHILTAGSVEHGTVRLYIRRGMGNWAELPMLRGQGAPADVNWRFTYDVNKVRVMIDRSGEAFDPPEEMQTFKVVVFPS